MQFYLGINHVTKSLNLATDDVILVTSFTYKAIQYTCQAVADKTGNINKLLPITQVIYVGVTYNNLLLTDKTGNAMKLLLMK